jgi:hypothetical protein
LTRIMKHFVSVIIVSAILVVSPPKIGAAQSKTAKAETTGYKYDTPKTKLEGILVERKVYGPPGYGETPAKDVRETILVLKLPRPIAVKPAQDAEAKSSFNQDPANNVREVQLFLSHDQTWNTKALLGRVVIATGTLNESVTASQRTKVWLSLQKLDSKR